MSETRKGFLIVFNGKDYQVQPYEGQVVTWMEDKDKADELCRLLNDKKPFYTSWGDKE